MFTAGAIASGLLSTKAFAQVEGELSPGEEIRLVQEFNRMLAEGINPGEIWYEVSNPEDKGAKELVKKWYEADAWCRWAGRRLPFEVEWEIAAHTAARRGFLWGNVWEWTGTTFRGYSNEIGGFTPDPYVDYSQPWFGNHKVLRGASFATRARMKSPKYRNFYLPERDDMFCGFRSCSL